MTEPNHQPSWFDAHLDLAYLAVVGRDLTKRPDQVSTSTAPAAITLTSLSEANVTRVLATIFTEPGGSDACSYPSSDPDQAHKVALRQLDVYESLRQAGHMRRFNEPQKDNALSYGILIECADPVRSVEELGWWKDQGVVAIGLSWATSSRYAGGNETGMGLTPAGRELVLGMDAMNIVHDVSHLSHAGTDQLLSLAEGRVMASHSNCRSLLDGLTERHLSDDHIVEIGRRGGVIGLNLISPFLRNFPGFDIRTTQVIPRASIDDCVRHVEHICELQGHRRGVGLGSDADGGVSALALPIGLEHPTGYEKLAAALATQGWTGEELHGFRHENWSRFFGLVAPS